MKYIKFIILTKSKISGFYINWELVVIIVSDYVWWVIQCNLWKLRLNDIYIYILFGVGFYKTGSWHERSIVVVQDWLIAPLLLFLLHCETERPYHSWSMCGWNVRTIVNFIDSRYRVYNSIFFFCCHPHFMILKFRFYS